MSHFRIVSSIDLLNLIENHKWDYLQFLQKLRKSDIICEANLLSDINSSDLVYQIEGCNIIGVENRVDNKHDRNVWRKRCFIEDRLEYSASVVSTKE